MDIESDSFVIPLDGRLAYYLILQLSARNLLKTLSGHDPNIPAAFGGAIAIVSHSVAPLPQCPVLVCDADDDKFFRGQPEQLVDALGAHATHRRLTSEDAAGDHEVRYAGIRERNVTWPPAVFFSDSCRNACL